MSRNQKALITISVIVIAMMSPLLFSQHALLGVDGYFQYNRIYEAAMQIKHHNLSFINLYSFQQAGRVVNSLYSPLITYIAGTLLLILGTWYKFQIVTVFVVYLVAGYSMYLAARKFQFSQRRALALAVIFLTSNVVYGYIFGVTWRSLALALLPLFVGPILTLYQGDWTIQAMLKLGLLVGVLTQFQILTVVLTIPFFVPFAIHGLYQTKYKQSALLNLLVAILVALLLSLNTILPMLEVFSENTLIAPVAMQLMDETSLILQPIYTGVDSSSDIVLTIIIYAMLMGLVMFWARLGTFTRLFACVAVVYAILGTSLFPWDALQHAWPILQSFVQMPRRITLVGTPFLILATMLVYDDVAQATQDFKLSQGITYTSIFLALFSFILCTQKVAQNVHYTTMETTTLADGLQTVDGNVYSKLTHITELQPAFHTRDLSKLIKQVARTTPDYVPVPNKFETNGDVYHAYRTNFSARHAHFKHKVIDNGVQLIWTAKHAKKRAVPIVKYRRTTLTLNGKTLTDKQVKQQWSGNLVIKQHKGRNVLTVRYRPSFVTRLGTHQAVLAWIIAGLSLLFMAFNLQDNATVQSWWHQLVAKGRAKLIK